VGVRGALGQTIAVSGHLRADSARGSAVRGAEVVIVPDARPTRSDSTGAFYVTVPAPGQYLLNVRAIGFKPLEQTIEITGKDSVGIDVVMHTTSTVLPTVNVKAQRRDYLSPALRGFEDRRAKGFGRFVAETTLRTMDNRQLAEVLTSQVPGLQVLRRASESFAVSSRNTKTSARVLGGPSTTRPACYSTIYLDGILVYDLASASRFGSAGIPSPPPNLSDYLVSSLAGIEFYGGEATAPSGYRHSGCGLLLLWTRER
jgi:hypothetical protein